jgi:hypothetical protein
MSCWLIHLFQTMEHATLSTKSTHTMVENPKSCVGHCDTLHRALMFQEVAWLMFEHRKIKIIVCTSYCVRLATLPTSPHLEHAN